MISIFGIDSIMIARDDKEVGEVCIIRIMLNRTQMNKIGSIDVCSYANICKEG